MEITSIPPKQIQALYESICETGNELVAELYTGKITYAGYAKAGSEAFFAAFKSLAEIDAA